MDPKMDLFLPGRHVSGCRSRWMPHLCMVSARVNLLELNRPHYELWNKASTTANPAKMALIRVSMALIRV